MTTLTTTNNTLQKVGHKHEAIMIWLLENPEAKLADCAIAFKVTQCWLSIVIHSDAFQDEFAKHREKFYGGTAEGLAEKLNGLAHLAVERLSEKIEDVDDPAFILNATDKLLGRLGYGGKTEVKVNAENGANVQVVSSTSLVAAEASRKRLRELKAIEGEVIEKT